MSQTDPEGRLAPDPDDLIRRHLDLPALLARRYRGPRLADEDLEAEANLALVEAARSYDLAEHPGVPFRAYAGRRIRRRLWEAIERAPMVRMPRSLERRAMRGDAPAPRPHDVAVEELGTLPAEADLDGDPLPGLVAGALDRCTEAGRAVLQLVALDGLSIGQAARRLGISPRAARAEHDAACRAVAGEFRSRGWDASSWARAIA